MSHDHNSKELQDSIAMLKIVAMSSKSRLENNGQPVKNAFSDIRKRVKETAILSNKQ